MNQEQEAIRLLRELYETSRLAFAGTPYAAAKKAAKEFLDKIDLELENGSSKASSS